MPGTSLATAASMTVLPGLIRTVRRWPSGVMNWIVPIFRLLRRPAQRQVADRATDPGRDDDVRAWLDFEIRDALQPFLDEDLDFHLGQERTWAAVNAVPKR